MSSAPTVLLVTRLIILIVMLVSMSRHEFARAQSNKYELEPVIEGLAKSWGLAVSADNTLFVSHREGDIGLYRISDKGTLTLIQILAFKPDDLLTGGQGGLLDIELHPDYARSGWVYLSYSAGTDAANALKIVRFKVESSEASNKPFQVSELQTVFEAFDKKDTPVHYGARMVFDAQGALLVTTGDGFDYREQAQIKSSHLGKVLRMSDTGAPHPGNPFFTGTNAPQDYIFTLGHRNPQGLISTTDGLLVAHEHGPAGGDEINVLRVGENYGWPVITQGKDYIGATISPFTEYQGMRQPAVNWTPSIAPSGMVLYEGKQFEELQNCLLVTSLKYQQIYVVRLGDVTQADAKGEIAEKSVGASTLLATPMARLRDIVLDPSGQVWVLGDGTGDDKSTRIFRLSAE
ncbi:PQQ-dependent sugar dehydrogenase [Ningiella sp. W23]|uniref:PQQ-dependent sugar dehydrogenase n=1 Tax=Ningiella sp. W23 TaxID=3023715 RepID=UPI0037580D18